MRSVTQLVPRQAESAEESPLETRAVYTVVEAARLLSLSRGSAYSLVRNGTIPALKVGGRWLIPKRRFHAWLNGMTESEAV